MGRHSGVRCRANAAHLAPVVVSRNRESRVARNVEDDEEEEGEHEVAMKVEEDDAPEEERELAPPFALAERTPEEGAEARLRWRRLPAS